MKLQLKEAEINPEIKILDIKGRIDTFTNVKVQEELDTLLHIGSNKIVCNLSLVDHISPAGLRTFFHAIREARRKGGDLKLAALQIGVQRIFEFAGFKKLCTFYPDVDTAIQDFLQDNSQILTPEEQRAPTEKLPSSSEKNIDPYAQTLDIKADEVMLQENNTIDPYAQTMDIKADEVMLQENNTIDPYAQTMDIHQEKFPTDFTVNIDQMILDKIEEMERREESGEDLIEEHETKFSYRVTYRVRKKLAEGNIGKLYLGMEISEGGLSRPVALKYIQSQYATKENLDLLVEELKKATLVTHQNIGQVYKLVNFGKYYFIIMEYIQGTPLSLVFHQLKSCNRTFPPDFAAWIIYTLAKALSYANQEAEDGKSAVEIVHGKIDSDHVLLTPDAHIKLVGLGICKIGRLLQLKNKKLSSDEKILIAPEVLSSGKLTKAGDIFSLGVLFYEMVTGKKPYSLQEITEDRYSLPIPPSQLNKKLTEIMDKILFRCLVKDVNKRFSSYQDIELQLEQSLYNKGLSLTHITFQKFLEMLKNR